MTISDQALALPPLSLQIDVEQLVFREPLRVTGYEFRHMPVVVATVRAGGAEGRGEAAGVYYLNDDAEKVVADLHRVEPVLRSGISRDNLSGLLGASGARNALDCALWDIEAQLSGIPAWERAGLGRPAPVKTVQTLGAETPDRSAARALANGWAKAFKLKLLGDADDAARVRAVHAARPDAWLGVDANQGLTPETLIALMPTLVECGVGLIEQPLPRGEDARLGDLELPIPVAADESLQDMADLLRLSSFYQVANIKLDKCGGLTEALRIAEVARTLGLAPMVGNMTGTSLAMAPAYLLAQMCDFVDLDGPTFITEDTVPAMAYDDGTVTCPTGLWGLL